MDVKKPSTVDVLLAFLPSLCIKGYIERKGEYGGLVCFISLACPIQQSLSSFGVSNQYIENFSLKRGKNNLYFV
jgi:hypothetical protein